MHAPPSFSRPLFLCVAMPCHQGSARVRRLSGLWLVLLVLLLLLVVVVAVAAAACVHVVVWWWWVGVV